MEEVLSGKVDREGKSPEVRAGGSGGSGGLGGGPPEVDDDGFRTEARLDEESQGFSPEDIFSFNIVEHEECM